MKTQRRRRRKGSRSFWKPSRAGRRGLSHVRGRGLRVEPLEDRRLLSNSPPVAVDDGYVIGQDETLAVTGLPEEMLTVSLRAKDLEYDSVSGMFYAAVGTDGGARANSLTEIDPASATLGNSIFISGEPMKLLVADDGQYAYATVSSGQEIQRFNLPSETADMKFAMPSGRSVESMDVIPGWSEAVIVSREYDGYSPRHGGVAVYQNGVPLPNETPGFLGAGGPNILTVDETGTKAYGYQNELSSFTFYELGIDASGVQITNTHHGVLSGYGIPKIEYEDGRIYAYTGEVVDLDTLATVGNFPGHRHYLAESETGRLYTLTTRDSTAIIETFNLANMVKMDTMEIPGIIQSAGDIIRFGERGLAFRDLENVYFLQTNIVPHGGQYGVLENDEDADGDLLTAFVVDGPDHGDLKLNTDGSFTYTPESGFLDVDTFTYEVTDGQAVSNVATVTVLVGPSIVVNSTADPGDGTPDATETTLREAIDLANATPGTQTIVFDVPTSDPGYNPGTGAFTIQPLSALPEITDSVVIDGWTQPGFDGKPIIELDGSLAGSDGLVIATDNSTVRGLVINRFSGNGIVVDGGDRNAIEGNFIGTDVTGTVALGNAQCGVLIQDAAYWNRIGTNGDGLDDEAEHNVISGNGSDGVLIRRLHSGRNVVAGNYLGTDVSGTIALGNGSIDPEGCGVRIGEFAWLNRIGTNGDGLFDEAERNVISGNLFHGVLITGRGSNSNVVAGNWIGIDATGAALGNGYGSEPGAGIALAGVSRARIGTNGDGLSDDAERNVISGNASHGVVITGGEALNNVVAGNYIGTDVTGAEALGNGGHGVYITSGPFGSAIGGDAASGNLIAWNAGAGVAVVNHSSLNHVQANSIHDNGGLGIDLGDDGVTPNDPGDEETGMFRLQNYPVITSALVGASTLVTGTLRSAPNAEYTLDFYANRAADPSGFGEGERWLGSAVVTTDASCSAAFDVLLPSETTCGELITATATGTLYERDTSEFSAAARADPAVEYPDVVMADGPFAYYRLGEAAGATTAVDEIGVHHGTYVNDPTLEVPGAVVTDTDTAAQFDATQYVEGTTMADYGSRMIDGFTIECWVRLSVPTDWSNILGTANPGYTTNVQLSVDETRSMRLYFRDDDWDRYSVWFYSEGHNAEIFDQQWHHLVFAYDPIFANPSDRFELYIDSVPQELEVQPGNDRPDGTSDFVYPMILGGWHQRGTVIPTYDGDLDEVAFYTRPLSWTEAGEHYGVGVGNHVPMAIDDAYYVEENALLVVAAESGVLANDSDADGDPLDTIVVSLPSHGDLTEMGDDGSFIYTPDPDFRGVDTFTYKATDGEADSNVATVMIGVSPDVVVNSTADPGDGVPDVTETTLREAIDAANAIPGTQTILFDVPTTDPGYNAGAGTFTIQPRFALPEITDSVVLDAWTQPGFAGAPIIEIDGSLAGTDGLVITADNSTVRGLVINRFSGNGIVLDGGSHNAIEGNYIGTDVSGTVALGNGFGVDWGYGVVIQSGAQSNRIGTNGDGVADASERNVISANADRGVTIWGTGTDGNVVAGNYIGTDASGTNPLGNGDHGVYITDWEGAPQANLIGTNGDGIADEAERNVISANALDGVRIRGAGTNSNVVAGNYIGTDVTGAVALGNGYDGVAIEDGAQANRVGTDGNGVADTAERNLISGNANLGVRIYGAGTDGNVVAGNYIGTDVSGTMPLGNGFGVEWGHAVVIGRGAQFNRIGTNGDDVADAAERNVISANAKTGVVIQDSGTDHNVVAGNFIGTDAAGLNALDNGQHGVLIQNRGEGGPQHNLIGTNGDGVADEAEGNLISGNVGTGMVISGVGTDHNVVAGNHIGTDVSGTVALGNGAQGVYIVAYLGAPQSNRIGTNGDGVADAAERNVISGNSSHGVLISGAGTDLNVVAGNYIGTDASGTVALGNGFDVEYGAGVAVFGGAQSNRIGTDGNGVADAAERNVISGNSSKGVSIGHEETSDNVVAGNYIGTDVTGTVALGNGQDGVKIWWASNQRIGGTSPEEGNLISGNARYGVFIQGAEASSNLVQGNYIGTDVSGTEALGNGAHGVLIADGAHSNAIGGDAASGNRIAWNGGAGVAVVGEDTTGNRIQANSIHDNGGLGIDLGDDGVTPNAPTHGVGTPSRWQDYPVITAALVGASTRVIGTLYSPPNAEYTLDFYANAAADPTGFGEGERWLGSTVVTTDASGNAAFSALLSSETTSGELITATATDADGNTSEFSAAQDARTVDLGTLAFEELLELDLSEGAIWFRLETCRAGDLTVEAVYDPAAGTAELTLFDKHGHPLATSSDGTGHERIDYPAGDAGEVFWIELTGTNPRVDLRLCNQVLRAGTRVSVYGTDGDDRFEFEANVPPPVVTIGGVDHRVTINGVAYTFTLPSIPPPVLFVTFDGGDGEDTTVSHGSAGNDRVKLWPDRGRVDGFGYTVITKNVEAATVHGGGGADVAVLYDSQGPDAFTAGSDSAEMTGPGFALSVHGFPKVHAFASDDGQTDTAILEDRAGSKERFRAWPTEAKMCGLGFYNRAKGFDEVQAGASDATDVAEIHDSPGADAFEAYADRATMSYEDGTVVRADDFRWLFAFASDDGQTDTAHLYDTTADPATSYASWFKGFNGIAKMYAVSTFYNRVNGFDEVIASVVGSDDTAKLFDSPGADALEAYADQATMTYADGTVVRADDFRWVLACGSDDGQVDTAQLYDTTADLGTSYATWFKAANGFSKFYEDPVFYIQAQQFDRVSATAVGDDDTAKLFDSALDDVYWSRPDHSRMEYGDGTFAEALDFRYVLSHSRDGSDTATLYDATAGGTSHAARFVGSAAWAKLYDGAFYSRTEGFAEVRAVFWGGDDLAWLEDDPTRTDHLVVFQPNPFIAAAQAKLWNDRRAIYVDYFHTLTATTSQDFVDDADIDPAYEDDVILRGDWADA